MSLAEPVQTEIETKHPFVSGHSRAQWVTALLLIVILIDVLAIIFDFSQIQLLSRVQAGIPVSEAKAVANDSRQAMMVVSRIKGSVPLSPIFAGLTHFCRLSTLS